MPSAVFPVVVAVTALAAISLLPHAAGAQIEPLVVAQADVREVAPGSGFRLALGSTARIRGTDLYITFERVVEDSRCPVKVQCVWAGEVTLELRIRSGDAAEQTHTIVLPGGGGAPLNVGPLGIREAWVTPPRDPARPLQPYVLRLRLDLAE
jgi:hypothetical protein